MSHQVALITGGASGIGKATALKLAAQGITVVISGRREDLGQAAVEEIKQVATDNAQVRFIKNDVTQEQDVKEMIAAIVREFGQLDMAVNNAGISNETGTIVQSDTHKFNAMIDTNLLGLYYCMKYEVEQMVKQGKGAIVNLASIAGLNGIPWAGTYAATKHAVVGLTKSAALDYATQGIRINGVAPGAIKTDIIAAQLDGSDENYNEDIISAMHPMNRLGKPEEIANGISWLLSDEASFVTGHILNIDGGFQAK
ncbi:short chain dehydrogenase family protein [Yersinia rohdei]|uniref:Short chain dehydrogenase family protein n=1 Tax=Yersinia rohdei TaxID=29485 RepID=A0ABM5S7Q1_YERRO|nr:glucose 1-dehydrogenase [Yersinia rohdei]AJJ09246.1 short chain dehydrogenase family protein [Yersinia rohdei]EEQ01831.1 Short chain dehydrogenase [Yersinia rohdei ATCC 43380]MDN0092858.1 glucose 1-dehydrogenase [Yersinia rohdei]CNI30979.1 putative short chain dehydrogenase [Yersinia rohdei]CQJ47135.1 putative short chain dehydrogenase [Yersinia rohdei]